MTHTQEQLTEILRLHRMWRRGEDGGARADMSGAYLSEANLRGANLSGAVGNMREVKSAQFDRWVCSWSRSPDGVTTLNIGCQSHRLETWKAASHEWIAALDPAAADWWARYGRILLELVEASPATPWGKPAEVSR